MTPLFKAPIIHLIGAFFMLKILDNVVIIDIDFYSITISLKD
jgi:hypothetical protein